MPTKEKIVNWCSWEGREVNVKATSCYWVLGKKPECRAYIADKRKFITGKCMYLVESIEDE